MLPGPIETKPQRPQPVVKEGGGLREYGYVLFFVLIKYGWGNNFFKLIVEMFAIVNLLHYHCGNK
jgi:hypothetical protein